MSVARQISCVPLYRETGTAIFRNKIVLYCWYDRPSTIDGRESVFVTSTVSILVHTRCKKKTRILLSWRLIFNGVHLRSKKNCD